jgi:hypothetical protein
MRIALLRELHGTRPFIPFTLTLADGRKLNVIHNEFLAFFPSGRAAMLTHADDRFTMFDLAMVTSADVDPTFQSRRSKKSARKHS